MSMAVVQPPGDDEYVTKAYLREELGRVERRLEHKIDEAFSRCATKEDLERFATKEDVERMGRVLAWGLVGGVGAMLTATLAGMWGVVHTLVSLAS